VTTPDLTRAQIVALVQAAIGCAVAFGAPITEAQSGALLALVGVLSVVLVAADASIRRARAKHIAGPILDRAAADAITRASGAVDPRALRPADLDVEALRARALERLATEAELEQAAHDANLGAPSSADPGPASPPGGSLYARRALAGPETPSAKWGDVDTNGDLVNRVYDRLVTRTGLEPSTCSADHVVDLAEHLRRVASELTRATTRRGNP
jgi:hypothetical protein